MAVQNGNFFGVIDGKSINDYSFQLDYSIEDLDKRVELVKQVLNLDENGLPEDQFWQDIWDIGQIKVNPNTSDALWNEGNIAQFLESMGTYLMAKDESEANKENRKFSRPKKETYDSCLEEYSTDQYEVAKNDKNYRLAPKEDIYACDYRLRKPFSKDYDYYVNVVYPEYINGLKKKIEISNISRYGHHDGLFEDFACGKLMDEETWNNLKRLELQKISLLTDASENLQILKDQNEKIKTGSILKYRNEDYIEVYKHRFIDNIIPLHVQLKRSGYDNSVVELIEKEYLYTKLKKKTNVNLTHIIKNISDIKDYMIRCKLAYNNRICITPDKNSANREILDYVDYKNEDHIHAMLHMSSEDISYENDMSIIAYDMFNSINYLYEYKMIDDKDMYIIDGIRHKVTHEKIALELGINEKTVRRRIQKIVNKIKIIC